MKKTVYSGLLLVLLAAGLVLAGCPSPVQSPEAAPEAAPDNPVQTPEPVTDNPPEPETVEPEAPAPEKQLTGIAIAAPPDKTAYLMGETIDLSGLRVNALYDDGSVEQTADYDALCDDTFTAGAGSVRISAKSNGDLTASFEISVSGELMDTGLPVLYIETENAAPILSKEEYVHGTILIKQEGVTLYNEQTMRIKGRGNATWGYPKKPYKIKLDNKTDFFGMGRDKDWVLLANYCDKTLLRTGIAFHLSKTMNFPWTPDAKFVELVLNGQYLGNYQLVEGVKQDGDRVNVSGSTGYIIERDGYYLQEPKYFVTNSGYGYSFKQPDNDDLTPEQLTYIEDYMNNVESVLASDGFNDPETGYQNYMDLDSFARWFLFQNVIANLDTNPYLTKNDNTAGSRICMGPVWDFEWSLGIGWYDGPRPRPADYWVWNHWYFEKLLTDGSFKNALKNVWNTNKTAIRQAVLAYISSARQEIYNSQKLNFRRWNILNTRVSVGGIPLGGFDAEVDCDVQFFTNHFEWLDAAINAE